MFRVDEVINLKFRVSEIRTNESNLGKKTLLSLVLQTLPGKTIVLNLDEEQSNYLLINSINFKQD